MKQIENKIYYFAIDYIHFYTTTFFLISFYFSNKIFLEANIRRMKERLIRIFMPYIFWPLIKYILKNVLSYYHHKKFKFNFSKLYYQLLLGNSFYPVFWFHTNLILFTILFMIIILLFKEYFLFIFHLIFTAVTFLNYKEYYKTIKIFTIRQAFFTILVSIAGFILGYIKIIDKLKRFRSISLIIFSPIFYVFSIHNYIINIFFRFKYLIMTFLISILFVFFGLLPFDLVNNNSILILLKYITSFTGGIYYLHFDVYFLFSQYFYFIKKANIASCIYIYI